MVYHDLPYKPMKTLELHYSMIQFLIMSKLLLPTYINGVYLCCLLKLNNEKKIAFNLALMSCNYFSKT